MDTREEFEKSEHIKERLAICYFDTNIGCYLSIQLRDYASASYLNGAWYAFQEQQKKVDAIASIITEAYMSGGNSSVEIVYDKIQELLK